MPRYGLAFGYRDNPDTLRRGRVGRGYMGGSTRRYGWEMYHTGGRPGRRGYGEEYRTEGYARQDRRRGWDRFTGMESNRARGVYGSDYRPGQGFGGGAHGGYRGGRGNYGGGMNPGRGRG